MCLAGYTGEICETGENKIQRTLLWFLQLKVSRLKPIFRQIQIHILPWPKKNRYSRDIHEVDRQSDRVISSGIELRFDIDRTLGICAPRVRVADRSRCCEISHDRTADQSHEYLGCNDFFGQGSICLKISFSRETFSCENHERVR